MRERLIAALVGTTVAVVVLFGVPRAYVLADMVRADEQREVSRATVLIAVALAEREAAGAPVTPSYLDGLVVDSEHVEYETADGRVAVAGHEESATSGSAVTATRPVAGGGSVTVSRPADAVNGRVGRALLPIAVLGVVLTVAAAIVGFVLARRLSAPFKELATAAGQLGHGRFDLPVRRYSVPEAEAIGTALRRAAGQLDTLVTRERSFATDASHQLRTPLTALRLELEDLALWKQTPPEVASALDDSVAELDRLNDAITDLLERSPGKQSAAAVDVDLAALVRHVSTTWAEGREPHADVSCTGAGPLPVTVVPEAVSDLVRGMLDVVAGTGTSRLAVSLTDASTHLQVRVEGSEGRAGAPMRSARGAFSGLAREAEAMGGHLSFEEEAPVWAVLKLPVAVPGS